MKRILLLSYLFLELQLLFAQTTISISANAVRHEDDLIKVQIPYIESGNPGSDAVWQLGIATDDSPEFLQSINSNGDRVEGSYVGEGRDENLTLTLSPFVTCHPPITLSYSRLSYSVTCPISCNIHLRSFAYVFSWWLYINCVSLWQEKTNVDNTHY